MSKTHPFEGLLVVDFTHVLAGPAASYYLGLLGAKVIKVESKSKGDAIRHRGGTDSQAAKQGMSTSYLTQGGAKKSIALDLETQEDMGLFHRLLAKADVLVENHVPDTMRRLGLDEESLAKRHPHLIHCAMTGYGRGGPHVPGVESTGKSHGLGRQLAKFAILAGMGPRSLGQCGLFAVATVHSE